MGWLEDCLVSFWGPAYGLKGELLVFRELYMLISGFRWNLEKGTESTQPTQGEGENPAS